MKLAGYLSAGLLKAVYAPPKDIEGTRRVIRRHGQLVKIQTQPKTKYILF